MVQEQLAITDEQLERVRLRHMQGLYMEGFSIREIAKCMDLTPAKVEWALERSNTSRPIIVDLHMSEIVQNNLRTLRLLAERFLDEVGQVPDENGLVFGRKINERRNDTDRYVVLWDRTTAFLAQYYAQVVQNDLPLDEVETFQGELADLPRPADVKGKKHQPVEADTEGYQLPRMPPRD